MATVTTAPALVRSLTNHPTNQPTMRVLFAFLFLHSYKAKKKLNDSKFSIGCHNL
jgi:hypothetical protein